VTVRLTNITAAAHTDGNRIELSWTNPVPQPAPGVRVVRRTGTHPTGPDDGVVVADGIGLTTASDTGLQGETVYYYTLFPFSGSPPVYSSDLHNQTSAMATAPYDFAGQIYAMLPAIYRRYDAGRTPAPGTGLAFDQDKGELRRFLDLPGAELDRLYSLTRAALSLANLYRVEGRLLPQLGDWIGWPTNYTLPVGAQRNEIRFAPRIYQTIGAVPNLDATVTRITGWANRTKEFVHNVARTTQPEQLNLWFSRRDASGTFSSPAFASTNFAYDGRPTVVGEADGSALFFYHTQRLHGWDIWTKPYAAGAWQPSQPVVDRPGIDKHPSAALAGNRLWLFWQGYDPNQQGSDRISRIWFSTRTTATYTVATQAAMLALKAVQTVTLTGPPTAGTFTLTYGGHTTTALNFNAAATDLQTALTALSSIGAGNVSVTGPTGGPWVVTFQGTLGGQAIATMTATSSLTGGSVSVATTTPGPSIGNSCTITTDQYQGTYTLINTPASTFSNWTYSYGRGGGFTAPAVFGDPGTERRMPTAVADNAGGLWLFWLEQVAGAWQVRYNRHDGTKWLETSQTLPPDAGQPARVDDDMFALFHPTSASQRLWLFWARHEPGGPPGQTRWSVVYRIKQGLDPAAADWSPIRPLPKTGTGGYHDRQPAVLLAPGGDLEVYVSSTLNGGWTIVRNTLAVGTLNWGTAQQVVGGPYTRRGPLAVDTGAGTLLVFRSNQSLTYASETFSATQILDHRYAGTTTVDTGGTAKLALRGQYEDFQTYTYDAGQGGTRTNDDRIARDTVGLYLTPGTTDPAAIKAMLSRLAGELKGFLPVTARAVYITS
jgi:hypothetical protein